jgi:hypothetical protein
VSKAKFRRAFHSDELDFVRKNLPVGAKIYQTVVLGDGVDVHGNAVGEIPVDRHELSVVLLARQPRQL